VKGRLPLKMEGRIKPQIAQMTQTGGEVVRLPGMNILVSRVVLRFYPYGSLFEVICAICGIFGLEFEA
jgi:hypothetical protein